MSKKKKQNKKQMKKKLFSDLMRIFLLGVMKLHGSLILFNVLQLSVMKQKFKLNSIGLKNLLP